MSAWQSRPTWMNTPKHSSVSNNSAALELLKGDAVDPDPPPGLWISALARIAEHKCRSLPLAPLPSHERGSLSGRPWWRRMDVAVAALLLIVVGGMGLSFLGLVWDRYRIAICQNNLRNFHQALLSYSDMNHGQFPCVEAKPPRNHAGYYLPILHEAGVLPAEARPACPADSHFSSLAGPLPDLKELDALHREKFREVIQRLGGSYAYSLGYQEMENGQLILHGLMSTMDSELPIMADRPPYSGSPDFTTANSPNHGGTGQNVLYIGGHVRFCTTRFAGFPGDDIYLNADRHVEAGRGPHDTVLGSSEASPYPGGDE